MHECRAQVYLFVCACLRLQWERSVVQRSQVQPSGDGGGGESPSSCGALPLSPPPHHFTPRSWHAPRGFPRPPMRQSPLRRAPPGWRAGPVSFPTSNGCAPADGFRGPSALHPPPPTSPPPIAPFLVSHGRPAAPRITPAVSRACWVAFPPVGPAYPLPRPRWWPLAAASSLAWCWTCTAQA
jgi:hypothetical protein